MEKENENTTITKDDLQFIKGIFGKNKTPVSHQELATRLAFEKNSSQMNQEVKIYDSRCRYEIGDLIYKPYDEPLLISSKGVEPFHGAVVLKVVNIIKYEAFQYEMLEVDYSGGGTFRKHIEYMKKTKTQVLLPSNQDNQCVNAKVLEKEDDPRLHELPMPEKDLKSLEKNLVHELTRSKDFFNWNEFWQLKKNQLIISDEIMNSLQTKLSETKKSCSSSEIISQAFGISPDSDLYEIYWISQNHALSKQKKRFILVSPEDRGKWHLKELIDSFIKDLPLNAKKAKVPSFEDGIKPETSPYEGFPLKLYLSWREILSGGVVVPKNMNRELSHIREYIFKNSDSKKEYTVYYYPTSLAFIGLKEFYESNNVPQGASLTLKRTGPSKFFFSLKTIKKKLEVPKVTYDPVKDEFKVHDETDFSYCSTNKIIFLEKETLKQLFTFYKQRKKLDLKELLLLVMKNFGYEGNELFLHSLRAFHLVDLLKRTFYEDVEYIFRNSSEFMPSEKKKGVYIYQETAPAEEEDIIPDEGLKTPFDEKEKKKKTLSPKSRLPEIGTIEGDFPGTEAEEGKLQIVEAAAPSAEKKAVIRKIAVKAEEISAAAPEIVKEKEKIKAPALEIIKPKKPKEGKKKGRKVKLESERGPKRRKGVKKIREEQIKLEESEMEALFAIKTVDKKEFTETKSEEKKADYKAFVQKEEPKTGMFAAKLKTALTKSKKEQAEKKATKRRRKR